jgi:hypothetical protein
MSPEPMAESEVRRCCKVLDNFDKSLKHPTLFWAKPLPRTHGYVFGKHCRVLEVNIFDLLTIFLLLLKKNYNSWYCMPPTSVDAAFDGSKKWKTTPGSLLQRKIPRIDAGQ